MAGSWFCLHKAAQPWLGFTWFDSKSVHWAFQVMCPSNIAYDKGVALRNFFFHTSIYNWRRGRKLMAVSQVMLTCLVAVAAEVAISTKQQRSR